MKTKKYTKGTFMFIMARLVACTNFDELEQLFVALCMVCLAKHVYPEIHQYVQKIENSINFEESILKLNVCLCVCVCVRGNNKSIENLLVNVVYLFICDDYQESKQFS